MTTEVQLCNLALSQLGVTEQIASVGTGTLAEVTATGLKVDLCNQWYAYSRDEFLKAYPWRFARKFATLALADDGTGEIWRFEWANAYTYPTDCLQLRRFVNDLGGGSWGYGEPYNASEFAGADLSWRYVVRVHDGDKVILTDVSEVDADMEYTEKVTDLDRWDGNPSAVTSLMWLLGHRLAPGLSLGRDLSIHCWQMYQQEVRAARALDGNEDNPHPAGRDGGSYIAARGSD